MDRITIYDDKGDRLGWFDRDAAECIIVEDSYWDGRNHRGTVSGMQVNRAALHLTKGGRWVEHADHRPEYSGPDIWRFLTDDEVRAWLAKCGGEDAEQVLAERFPDTPDEVGPEVSKGGRPSIGPTINVAYPRDLLDRVEAAADKAGQSRAEWLREAARKALEEA